MGQGNYGHSKQRWKPRSSKQAYVSHVLPITEQFPLSDLQPAQGRPSFLNPTAIRLSISAGLSLTLLAPQSPQRSVQARACSRGRTGSITHLECPKARHQVRGGDRNQITLMLEMRLGHSMASWDSRQGGTARRFFPPFICSAARRNERGEPR